MNNKMLIVLFQDITEVRMFYVINLNVEIQEGK